MDAPLWLVNALTLLRLLAFMVVIYLAIGLLVERYSTKPNSKVKAFFRILCSPVTRLVARLVRPPADERRLLRVSLGVVGGIWIVLIVLSEVVARG